MLGIKNELRTPVLFTEFCTRNGLTFALLAAIAIFAVGAVYSQHLGDQPRYADEQTYVAMANNIAGTGVFSINGKSPTAFRAPVYPATLSVLAYCGAGIRTFRVLNYLALSACLILLHLVARRIAGPVAACFAVALACAYPVFFYAAGTVFPQTVGSLLLLLGLWLHLRNSSESIVSAFATGLVFALMILTIPPLAVAAVVVFGWILLDRRRKRLVRAISFAAAVLFVLGPWCVRNYRVFDALIPVSTNGGLNLLLGNSAGTTPNVGSGANINDDRRAASGMDEIGRDRYYAGRALRYMRDNPGRTAKLYAMKFVNYFNYKNTLVTKRETSLLRNIVVLLTYGPLLALAVVRLFLSRRVPLTQYERFAYILYLASCAVSAVFFTRIRFRIPMDFVLITISATLLGRLLGDTADGPSDADRTTLHPSPCATD